MRARLASKDRWSIMAGKSADEAALVLTDTFLKESRACIPKTLIHERKNTHSCVNDRVLELVKKKHASVGNQEATTPVKNAARASVMNSANT